MNDRPRVSIDELRTIALTAMSAGFQRFGYCVEAIAWAIEQGVGCLIRHGFQRDDREAERLVDLIIELGLTA